MVRVKVELKVFGCMTVLTKKWYECSAEQIHAVGVNT